MLRKIILLTFLISSFGLSSVSAQETPTKPINGGVINGKATKLPMPAYPPAARAVKAGGAVNVQVLIDENGDVVSANAVSGHPLLRQAAEAAAREAKFKPTLLSGQAVKINGIVVYNFLPPGDTTSDPAENPSRSDSVQLTKPINGGIINGKATSLPAPPYPPAARAVKASGAVNVQVLIDEEGKVASASAVSGHPLLRQAAEEAALKATFAPTRLSGQPVKVSGIIVYNFVLDGPSWMFAGFSLGTAETEGIRAKINLPVEFADEQRQLEAISGLSADEQKAHIANTVSLIKSKLNPADLWRFEFGLAKGKIMSSSGDENAILVNLAKFKELASSKPEGVQENEIKRAAELAKFADKGNLTEEDKQAIFSYLR